MKKLFVLCFVVVAFVFNGALIFAEDITGVKGGPKWLYIKSTKKPPRHIPYDEELKCKECHTYQGVDAYTTATMSLKKSKTGALPRKELEQRIAEIVKGTGDYREIYILSTSYNNKPLATTIEFVLDPKTMTFYAFSEKQGEKLFHIASNPNVSFEYVKQFEDHLYFKHPLCVQVVGKAKLIHTQGPEMDEAMKIYLPTLEKMISKPLTPPFIEQIKKTKIITKVTAERIIIKDYTLRPKGYRLTQIWEREGKK